MSWLTALKTAGASALSILQFLTRLLYIFAAPLRWALYQVYSLVSFLLSPFKAVLGAGLGVISLATNVIARLKYLYIYLACAAFIGVCAGFMLHGTLSFSFALLGLNDAPKRRKVWGGHDRTSQPTSQLSLVEEEDKAYDYLSSPDPSGRHLDMKQEVARAHQDSIFEERWRLLRIAEQPKRRRKGLLGQIIHEESSGSDLS
ncbi:hypothetical protein GGS21DRAFT_15462 [Xylaria nigripes]|nr:hypothetical protein GGS21DRAFT_15462 [Xylaria nigripes]